MDSEEEANRKRKYYKENPINYFDYYAPGRSMLRMTEEDFKRIYEDVCLYGTPSQYIRVHLLHQTQFSTEEATKRICHYLCEELNVEEVTQEELKSMWALIRKHDVIKIAETLSRIYHKFFDWLKEDIESRVYFISCCESLFTRVDKILGETTETIEVLIDASTKNTYYYNLPWFLDQLGLYVDHENYWHVVVNLLGKDNVLKYVDYETVNFLMNRFSYLIDGNSLLIQNWERFITTETIPLFSPEALVRILKTLLQQYKRNSNGIEYTGPEKALSVVLKYIYSTQKTLRKCQQLLENVIDVFTFSGILSKPYLNKFMKDNTIPSSTIVLLINKGVCELNREFYGCDSPFISAIKTGRMELLEVFQEYPTLRSYKGDLQHLYNYLDKSNKFTQIKRQNLDERLLKLFSKGEFETMVRLNNYYRENRLSLGCYLASLYTHLNYEHFPKSFQYLVETYKTCILNFEDIPSTNKTPKWDTLIYVMRNDLHSYEYDYKHARGALDASDLVHLRFYSKKCRSASDIFQDIGDSIIHPRTRVFDISTSQCICDTCDCLERLQSMHNFKLVVHKPLSPKQALNLYVKHPLIAYKLENDYEDSVEDDNEIENFAESLEDWNLEEKYPAIFNKYKRFFKFRIKSNTHGNGPSVATWIINGFVDYVLAREMPITIDDLVELIACPLLLLNVEAKDDTMEDDLDGKDDKMEDDTLEDDTMEDDDEEEYEDEEAMPKYWLKRLQESGVDFSQSTSEVKMLEQFTEKYNTLLDVAKAFHEVDTTNTIVLFLEPLFLKLK